MSKIIGVTAGTPTSPEAMAEKLKPVTDEIYVGTSEPTDPNIKIWVDPNEEDIPEGGGVGTDEEIVAVLIETDMLPAVYDESGILCDENRNVILRY